MTEEIKNVNYIRRYYSAIKSGRVNVCEKTRREYEKLDAATRAKGGKYHFDLKRAMRPLIFVEKFCKQSKGEIGKPLKLELFQKAALQSTFGFVDDKGIRQYNEVLLIEGRKNGKSTLLAATGLYMLIGDKEGGAQVVCVASKRDQAKIVFDEAKNMVKQSPWLAKYIRKRRTDMYSEYNFGVFEPLSSDSNTLDGLNIHCGIIDELHSIKDRNLYDVVKQGTYARRQPLLFILSTAGFNRETVYDDVYAYAESVLNGTVEDEHFLPLIYELDKAEEWTDENAWEKANPGLGTIKDVEKLRQNVERAKHDAAFRPTVLTKDFNIKNVTADSWLTYEQLWNPATFAIDDVKDTYAIGGCDLSATTDLTCATLLIRKPEDPTLYVLQHYFLPESRVNDVEAMGSKEAPYRLWAEKGLLTLCEGTMVDYSQVTAWYVKMRDEYGIDLWRMGYDRALAGYWAQEMSDTFGASVMEKVAQGPFTWTGPMKELGAQLTDKKINYNANPMLAWCLSNTGVKTTGTVDSIQPVKIQTRRRIDGMVSLLNAYTIYVKYRDDYLNTVEG